MELAVVRFRYRAACATRFCRVVLVKRNNYVRAMVYILSLFKRASYVLTPPLPVSWLVRGMHMKRVLNRRRARCNSCSHYCDVHTFSSYHPSRLHHYVPGCWRCVSGLETMSEIYMFRIKNYEIFISQTLPPLVRIHT